MAIGSLALMLVASLAVATPASAYQVRVRAQVQLQEQDDSLVALRSELQRVVLAQESLTRQLRLAQASLRRGSISEREAVRMRVDQLNAQLQRSLVDADMLRSHMLSMCEQRPGPDGWLGIAFRETGEVTTSGNLTAFVVRKYPTIISVEPGSPAQKAGLLADDEIVALGGKDYGSGIDVAALLKPGTQLPVRFRRDGELRTVTVNVEPRPEGFISNCPWIEISAAPMLARPKLQIFQLPDGGFAYTLGDSTAPKVAVGGGERPGQRMRGTPVLPPTPYAPFRLRATVGPSQAVGGALLLPLNEDLREGLGLEEGILVVEVLNGSPALEAGLRVGDVITHMNGQKLRSVAALVAALEQRSREVELQVSRRNAKARTVWLKDAR